MIVVRNQNNINFTTVDNYFIKDRNLSTKAKGLLIQLLALPDGWIFSKKGIQSIVKEGRDFVENCMAELKENGYLVIDKYMNQETGFYEYEYQIYAIPIYCEFLPDGNIINRKTNEIGRGETFSLQNDIVNEKEIQFKQNRDKLYEILKDLKFKGSLDELKHHLPERLQISNRTLAKMIRSLSDQFDKKNIKWKLEKMRKGLVFSVGDLERDGKIFEELSSHLSSHEKKGVTIPDTEKPYVVPSQENIDKNKGVTIPDTERSYMVPSQENKNVTIPDTGLPDTEKPYLYKRMNNKKIDIRLIEKEVYQNIELESLLKKFSEEKDQKLVTSMYEAIVDTLYLKQDKIRMGNDIYSTEVVQNRYMELRSKHIEYVLKNIKNLDHRIHNVDAYIKKSLFTAVRSLKVSDSTRKKDIEDFPEWYKDTKQTKPDLALLKEIKNEIFLEKIDGEQEERIRNLENKLGINRGIVKQ
ncbi:MAG: DUF6017 domain-containing protein [Faecalicoccus sp.]|uniref:DUF6017 domain-containing protein n=1 Tax=Faecalicoccus sp. TaxID=1971758 RepID=UPI002A83273A|nr:DUF6017 domain-containing protein [Faecalicoccus sp.]MDY4869362.1 DUF6017 domain-containing protein [Faecalicoccus sp.]MDY5232763.1 DUF6017 domain-containing protein [Faecalicoccus sp.]